MVTVVRGRPERRRVPVGASVGWAPAAAALADAVVVEVDPAGPVVPGPPVPGTVVGVVEGTADPVAPAWGEPDDIDRAIAAHVATVLPPEPTIQYGPGALLDSIVRAVDRPVGIFSGLATDAVVDLARDDRLRGTAVAGYLWGTDALLTVEHDGRLRLAPSTETHDVARLTAAPRVRRAATRHSRSVSTASVNVERLGADVVGGVGGHPDFARGTSASPDGLSIVCCRSAHRGGPTSCPARW